MEFSYQNYVNRFNYKPYEWPPDIALAELHSRCSMPGPRNPYGVACPCCGFQTKKKLDGWLKRNIFEDFKDSGAGIPAYFGLQRFYNIVAIIILLINSLYPLYATYFTCQNYPNNPQVNNGEDICVRVDFYYLAFKQMCQVLSLNQHDKMVNTLEILQTIVFYVLLFANNLSIFYLVYIQGKCKKLKKSNQRYMSLLIQNLPSDTTEQSLKLKLTINGKIPKIKKITFLKELKSFGNIFRQRIKSYCQLKALYIESIDPKTETQMNEKLRRLNQQYLQIREVERLKNQKAIVVFQDRQELVQVHQALRLSEGYHWWFGLQSIFKVKNNQIPLFSSHMPQIQEIVWLNIGQNHTEKMTAKIKTVIICILLIMLCYALFYYPLKYSLTSHAGSATTTKLSLPQKILPSLIAFMMLGLSFAFRQYMQILAEKRNPKTHLQKSQFILATTVMFHLIFYLLIPTIFFAVENGLNQSVKLYAISEQARTFLIVQLILSVIDIVYRVWATKKTLSLVDQRQAFKMPQKFLHQRVQFREFPLQLKLVIMFKIWSFVLFYAFFLPYIMYLISFVMIILYFLEKRNLYMHYTQRRFLGVQLQIKFLNIYINFFCVYECIIYAINVNSNWQRYLAIASTVFSIGFQFFYWKILNNKLKKKKQKQLQLIKKQKNGQTVEVSKIKQQLLKQFDEIQAQDQKTYDQVYKQFLSQYYTPELDQQINNYLNIVFQNNNKITEQPQRRSRSVIQMS